MYSKRNPVKFGKKLNHGELHFLNLGYPQIEEMYKKKVYLHHYAKLEN